MWDSPIMVCGYDPPPFPDPVASSTRLPPEILGEIFLQSLPNLRESDVGYDRGHTQLEESGSRYRQAVSSLGRVCKYWRDVSIATPKIWSRIILTHSLQNPHKVEIWLQRSAQCPLTLRSLLTFWDLKDIVPEVLAQAQRWEDVKLDTDYRAWDDLSTRVVQFPFLHSLSIKYVTTDANSSLLQEGKWKLHILAPLLSNLELKTDESVMWDIRLLDIRLPLSQLTNLRLNAAIEAPEMFELLRRSRNLVSFGICVDYLHKLNLVHATPTIHLPLLESLDVDGDLDRGEGAWFLPYLDLPALTKFRCRAPVARIWPFTALATLVSRSHCSLHTLIINLAMNLGVATTWNNGAIECLEKLPDLVSLEIEGPGTNQLTTASFFRHLNGNSPHILRESCLVPRLKQFRMEINGIQHVEFKAFIDMLQSRFQLTSPGAFEPLETVALARRKVDLSPGPILEIFTLKVKGKDILAQDQNGIEIPLENIPGLFI